MIYAKEMVLIRGLNGVLQMNYFYMKNLLSI